MLNIASIKPHLKTLAASGAPLYVLGDGKLIGHTPNFTVCVEDDSLQISVADPSATCVLSAVKFNAFVSKAKTGFSVHFLDSGVRLLSGSLSVDFPLLNTQVNLVQPDYKMSIPTTTLKELLLYATAVTDAKATMTYAGVVHIHADPDIFDEEQSSSVKVQATDGYRALRMSLGCNVTPFSLLVPATLVAAVVNFTGETTEIADTENYLAFRSGNVEAVATKFAVKLPDIGGAFPARSKVRMSFAAGDIKEILGNLSPFLDTKDPDVVCSFEQKLVITTGTARDELKYDIQPTVQNPASETPNKKFKTPAKFLTDFISKASGTVQVETDNFDRILLTNGNKKYILAAKN